MLIFFFISKKNYTNKDLVIRDIIIYKFFIKNTIKNKFKLEFEIRTMLNFDKMNIFKDLKK